MRIPTRSRAAPSPPLDDAERAAAAVSADARKAGWSGVVLAVLLVAALVLIRRVPGLGASDADYTAFYAGGGAGTLTTVGLYVVPFAGIACLWHMISTRTLLQIRRPGSWAQVPHWLHLAASVIFVCMLFAGSAAAGAVALLTRYSDAPYQGPTSPVRCRRSVTRSSSSSASGPPVCTSSRRPDWPGRPAFSRGPWP